MYETHTFTDTREHVKINIEAPLTSPPPHNIYAYILNWRTIWKEANTRLKKKKKTSFRMKVI